MRRELHELGRGSQLWQLRVLCVLTRSSAISKARMRGDPEEEGEPP